MGTGNSAYDYIINNQWSSDWTTVNQQESWFAHQTYSGEPQSAADLASGRVLGNSNDWYQADIANPAWQQYTLNQVFQNMAATGSNAWFADSFTYGIGGAGYNSPIPSRYQGTNAANPADWPGGVTWTTQLGNWAQVIENAFAQHNATFGTNYKFIPNLDARATSWEPNWYNNASGVPIVDGAFLEGFGQYTDTYDWTLSMNRGLNLTGNGKIVIMQPYPSAAPNTAAGQQQVDFFLGTYLLLKGDQTYLNIDYGGGVQYYPEYQLNLGTPATPPQSNVSSYLWNGVYRRDFQNGFVLVNPGTTTYTLNLGGTYQQVHASGGGTMTDSQIDANGNYAGGSLTYQGVTGVTLAGGTAAVFLKPAMVSGVTVNGGAAQRSMVTSLAVTFSTAVSLPATPASAFTLTRVGDGASGDIHGDAIGRQQRDRSNARQLHRGGGGQRVAGRRPVLADRPGVAGYGQRSDPGRQRRRRLRRQLCQPGRHVAGNAGSVKPVPPVRRHQRRRLRQWRGPDRVPVGDRGRRPATRTSWRRSTPTTTGSSTVWT